MRINGRLLRYSTLAERRFMLGTLGVHEIRVPRSQNPYALARRLRRLVEKNESVDFFRSLITRKNNIPPMTPDVDTPEIPDVEHAHAAE